MRCRELFLFLVICLVAGEAALNREKRSEDFDPADLVVDVKFTNKKNKAITEFTQEEKDNLVNIHNAYRSLVRPYAANMIELTWDDEIAAFAQDWANNCTATHRSNRNLGQWINMGENLYWWYGGAYNEGKAVKYWWDEVQYYTMSTKKCVSGEVCGHYITMVWGVTEKIGCGVARCDRLWDHEDYGRGAYYFVCNYSGRFISYTKPYTATDVPCSSCHNTAYPKCRNNLCVTEDMLYSGEGYDGTTDMVGLYRSINYTSPIEGGSSTAYMSTITSGQTSITTSQAPTTSSSGVTTTVKEPTTTQEPTTTTQEPTTSTQEPTTTAQEPTTTAQEPTTTTQEPTTTTQEPTTSTQEPTTTTEKTITSTNEPTTTKESTTAQKESTAQVSTTTEHLPSTSMTTQSASVLSQAFEKINNYCRGRSRDYVRNFCWRLNNLLRNLLGLPNAQRKKRDLPGDELDTDTLSSEQFVEAFGEIDIYCDGRDTQYKRNVCWRLDNKFKEYLHFP